MIKKIDAYILRNFIGTFFFAIIILAVISCVIDYSEKVEDFVSHKAPLLEVINYFKNFVPFITAFLYPLFIFIATIFFTSRMAYRSELIAILASGTSFRRLSRPYFIGSIGLGLLALLSNHWIVPLANKSRLVFEEKYVHETHKFADENTHLRLSKNLLVYMRSYDYQQNMGYTFTAERVKGTLLTEKISAERASYDSVRHRWTLYTVRIRENEGVKETLRFQDTMVRNYPFTPRDLRSNEEKVLAMTTPQLNNYLAVQQTRGAENLNVLYLEKHRRTAQPFSGIVLTIIGLCISNKRIRGGSGFHLVIGIVISAIYTMMLQFANTFSTNADLSPALAVWIPNLLFGIVAVVLYRRELR